MEFQSFEEFENWIHAMEKKLGQKVAPTVFLPSRFLVDVLPMIPDNMKVTKIEIEGTTWGADTFQKVNVLNEVKFYESVAIPRFRVRGIMTNPRREQLWLLLKECEKYGINPIVKKMALLHNDNEYVWEQHQIKRGSSLSPDVSQTRFAKALQKAKGGQARILDLKSSHNPKDTWTIHLAFNGFSSLRICSLSKKLSTQTETTCLVPSVKAMIKREEASSS